MIHIRFHVNYRPTFDGRSTAQSDRLLAASPASVHGVLEGSTRNSLTYVPAVFRQTACGKVPRGSLGFCEKGHRGRSAVRERWNAELPWNVRAAGSAANETSRARWRWRNSSRIILRVNYGPEERVEAGARALGPAERMGKDEDGRFLGQE